MKMPKQIHYWAKKCGLKHAGRRYRKYGIWTGHKRHWRVNCHGEFQMSEQLDTFDRWANSLEKSTSLPRYEKEFTDVVANMLGM